MADYHTTYKGPEGQSTEWDDIQRKLGNLPEKEEVWKPDPYAPEEEVKKDAEWLESKDVDELEELDDEFSDDRFLEQYRQKRLAELKKGTTRPKFGTLQTIRGDDFVREVTNAGEGIWVVCHLYQDRVQDCGIFNACIGELAQRYPNTKFVKILSTDCIPGYPDENLPTVLIYKDTKVIQNLVGLHHFGGRSTSPDKVALALSCFGDVCGDEEERKKQFQGVIGELIESRDNGKKGGADDSGSDDD